ncbi:MAG TPA: lysylphosphatidylglycerol synthase transmembrane domain-containing protein, partial [Patescibacteria group bacterium]|nr:lysylphosphatidylglycerol synthase transmembrane domain-containing protein [Patescibacteria group bacterium]
MTKPEPLPHSGFRVRSWLYIVLAAVLLYIVLPQLGSFSQSLTLVRRAHLSWLALAVVASLGMYFVAAAKYVLLAFKPLPYGWTTVMQVASALANRLLPAGIGNIGVNFAYLVKAKHSKTQAAVVVGVNNIVGLAGHTLLTGGFVVYSWKAGKHLLPVWHVNYHWVRIGVACGLVLLICGLYFRRFVRRALHSTSQALLAYARRPFALVGATLLSVAVTGLHMLCLWSCAQALGAHIPVSAVFIVVTAGVAAGTVSPTPGGLVGAEAGLVAALVAYGLPAATALAV